MCIGSSEREEACVCEIPKLFGFERVYGFVKRVFYDDAL